jgi:hypothetical protein
MLKINDENIPTPKVSVCLYYNGNGTIVDIDQCNATYKLELMFNENTGEVDYTIEEFLKKAFLKKIGTKLAYVYEEYFIRNRKIKNIAYELSLSYGRITQMKAEINSIKHNSLWWKQIYKKSTLT